MSVGIIIANVTVEAVELAVGIIANVTVAAGTGGCSVFLAHGFLVAEGFVPVNNGVILEATVAGPSVCATEKVQVKQNLLAKNDSKVTSVRSKITIRNVVFAENWLITYTFSCRNWSGDMREEGWNFG